MRFKSKTQTSTKDKETRAKDLRIIEQILNHQSAVTRPLAGGAICSGLLHTVQKAD